MTLRPKLFQHLVFLTSLLTVIIFTVFSALLGLAGPVQAAHPVPPQAFPGVVSLTLTPTKISNPVGLVNAGETVTFTIAFKSDIAGTIIVTDTVPAETSYQAGTISSLVATTTNVVTPDDSNSSVMAWTVANNVPSTLINLSFAVVVDSLASTGTQIVNVAWLSDTNDITTTAPVTLSVASDIAARIFLPIVLKGAVFSGTTDLLVQSINTGGVSVVEVRTFPDDELVLLCGMSDNTTQLCGSIPSGEYTIIATTLNCGSIKTIETVVGDEHTVTAECFGFPPPITLTTEVYIEAGNTGGDIDIEIRTRDASHTLKLACTVHDEAVEFCGSITSGTYRVIADTVNCNQIIAPTLLITGPEQIIPVSCAQINGVWQGRINKYFAE